MQRNSTNNFDKILVFPITEANQEILNMQQISHKKINESIIIRLDPNEWINFSMILKLKEYEKSNRQYYDDFVLFSRPLIKELLKELLQNLLNLKRQDYHILDYNLENVWIKFQIQDNQFYFKKLVFLGKIVKSYDQEGDCKIKQLIQPILNIYNYDNDQKLIHSELYQKIEIIISQRPYEYYYQQFGRNYKQTYLNQFKQSYIVKLDWVDPNDQVFRNTLINELYYYRLPANEDLLIQLQSKYQFIQDEITNYIKQFDNLFAQFNPYQTEEIKQSIVKIIKNKIQIRGYTNYVNSFLQFNFQVTNFIEKQEILYIFLQVIQQIENQIKSFCLLLLLDDILIHQQKYKQISEERQLQQLENNINYQDQLRNKVYQQLRDFYQEIKNHIHLNDHIEDQIFQHIDIELILTIVCQQLRSRYAEWGQDKNILIKQALISQQEIVKEEFLRALNIFIQNL